MISINNTPEEPDDMGGLGGAALSAGPAIRDTRMLERALRERWPIPDQYRDAIVTRQIRIAIDPSSSNREATSATRCLVSMEQQNADIALKMLDKVVPDQYQHDITATVAPRETAKELLGSPEYADFLRQRERDSDARIVCTNGHARNGKPLDDGHPRNGH